MKTLSGILIAAVAAGAIASPALAHDEGRYDRGYVQSYDCRDSRGGAAAGTLFGALAGAAIGSNVAHRGDRTGGALVGAFAGGLIGNGIGRSADHNACGYSNYGGYRSDTRYDRYDGYNPYRRGHDRSDYGRYRPAGQYGYDYSY